jgi:mono/diheme cytochrome c family protein
MRRIRTAALCAEIVFLAVAAQCQTANNASGGDSNSVQAGEQVFKDNCAVCHSIKPNEKIVGPSLYGEMSGTPPKLTEAQVRKVVLEGLGKMPDFKDVLDSSDLDHLLAYLRTLKPPDKK